MSSDLTAAAPEGKADAWTWLSDDEAAEMAVPLDPALLGQTRQALGDRSIDVALVPLTDRRKRILIADMDSTMIEQECIDELADILGLKEKVAAITEAAMRGELDFETALRDRVAMLEGVEAGEMLRVQERITHTPGGRTLVSTMRAHGAYAALVSGGFSFFTAGVAKALGFDEEQANTLVFYGYRLTGEVRDPILGRAAKRERLEAICRERGVGLGDALAVGDGANDLDMIQAAGLGVAFRAKPATAAAADVGITHGDLRALLFLQGYRRDDFVT